MSKVTANFMQAFIAVVLGIPLGVVSALNRNRATDHLLRVLTVAGLAVASAGKAKVSAGRARCAITSAKRRGFPSTNASTR